MARRDPFEDGRVRLETVARPLIESGVLDPLADRDEDAQLWMDCELCSFVENRLHHQAEPETLTSDQRTEWARRALASDQRLQDPRGSDYVAAFWIVDRGARAGTLALSQATFGHQVLPVFSLYVFPDRRSTGLAYRALRAVDQASAAAGFLGIRISTYWTWQAAVRWYLFRYGMWAWSFKRSIEFVWANLPPHTIAVGDPTARFSIEQGARRIELLTASRDGELLVWNESPEMSSGELDHIVQFHARSTFAVALAVHGWPLLRAGNEHGGAAVYDAGGPAVLAHKIGVFEGLDRRSGFDVRTPRIPGLPYESIAAKFAR